jgi:hypothetical protein
VRGATPERTGDLGDIVVLLLAGTLAGLRDRLNEDGFDRAAELVADLVEAADVYLTTVLPDRPDPRGFQGWG